MTALQLLSITMSTLGVILGILIGYILTKRYYNRHFLLTNVDTMTKELEAEAFLKSFEAFLDDCPDDDPFSGNLIKSSTTIDVQSKPQNKAK